MDIAKSGAGGQSTVKVLGKIIGADFNVTTDQAISIYKDSGTKFIIEKIVVTNASTSLTTAAGGVYAATAKFGTAIVAAAQVYSALTGSTIRLELTLNIPTIVRSENQIYLSLTTPQGAAATADIYVLGYSI